MVMRFRRAHPADIDRLLTLQAAYYAEDGYPFEATGARDAWQALIGDARNGLAYVIESASELVAYVVVTFGFSLEYLGRDAFIDEVYVAPAWRARGIGRSAMAVVEQACLDHGVKALHLEVETEKREAIALYRRSGFAENGRMLMTRRFPSRTGTPGDG